MSRAALPPAIAETRIVPVLRGLDPVRVQAVVGILGAAGIRVVEVTMDSPDAAESIRSIAGLGMVAGAGTIRTVDDAEHAVDAGAEFLVAPHTDARVVSWAVDRGLPIVPGIMTPSEAVSAWDAGAAAVKVFPASVVGPAFLRALRGPLPDVLAIPTGGITAAEVRLYLSAGAVAVGVGDWLSNHEDLSVVEVRAAALLEACRASG